MLFPILEIVFIASITAVLVDFASFNLPGETNRRNVGWIDIYIGSKAISIKDKIGREYNAVAPVPGGLNLQQIEGAITITAFDTYGTYSKRKSTNESIATGLRMPWPKPVMLRPFQKKIRSSPK
ncbi:hypothetical protein CC78DRAFT_603361 [Lojkania enalia]|uniref:Uncharacterized protein n=1 Tax=Lojkania enalia TaxID=147567 RepID=A0A9P4N856_9PLEO|nr:hypothetical protein CC78DRAFT_603361 [Didymosphaeria enalia]